MSPISSTRELAPNCFARQIAVQDLDGFFQKQFTVDTGYSALIVENGQFRANLGPSMYTVAGLLGQLKSLVSDRQCTLVLTKSDEQPLQFSLTSTFTSDNIPVDVRGIIAVQIEDIPLFLLNMLGHRPLLTQEEMVQLLAPLVGQAIAQSVCEISIADLTGSTAQQILDAALAVSLRPELKRYGLRYAGLRSVSVSNEQYGEAKKSLGEVAIAELQAEARQRSNELELNQSRKAEELRQKKNEIEQLRGQNDQRAFAQETEDRLYRKQVYERLLQATHQEDLTKFARTEELNKLIGAADGAKVLREQDIQQLRDDFALGQQNRAQVARRLQDRAQFEQECALAEMRFQLDDLQFRRKLEQDDLRAKAEIDHIKARRQLDLDAEAQTVKLLLDSRAAETGNQIRLNQALRGASETELIAMSDPEKGKLIADVAIQRGSQNANVNIAALQLNRDSAVSEEAVRQQELRIAEVRQSTSERVADQMHNSQVAADLARATIQSAGQVLGDALTRGSSGMLTGGSVVCTGCRTANAVVNKFCSQCGRQL
jgi:hypothetical protein